MKSFLWMLLLLTGCRQWTSAELGLVTQARRGVALAATRSDASVELMKLQRERLDRAFDEDVRARAELSADWVIDARKAYGAALDAFAKRQAAADAAEAARARNLEAVDAALARLEALLSIQQKFSIEEIGR